MKKEIIELEKITYEAGDNILYAGKNAIFQEYFAGDTVGVYIINDDGSKSFVAGRVGSITPVLPPAVINGKVKVYIFDFGDTPIITHRRQDILDHIGSDIHDLKDESEELNYTITTKTMTEEEYAALPEWS